MIRLTEEQAEEILFTEPDFFDEDDEFQTIEVGTWHGDGKFQHCHVIFKRTGEDELYRLNCHRSGSAFTDWYRTYDLDCKRVERKEVVTHEYVDCDPS